MEALNIKYHSHYEILSTIGEAIKELQLIKRIDTTTKFYRGRAHNKEQGYNTVEELAPPKKEHAIYDNRMSAAGIPKFYGAFDIETVISEEGKNNQYITVGEFYNLKNMNLIDFTEIPKLPSLFDKQRRYLINAIIFLNSFIKDISKPIDKDLYYHIEYVPTQIVCEYLKCKLHTKDGSKVDGIIYPSSKNKKGKCCALFVENEECTEHKDEIGKML